MVAALYELQLDMDFVLPPRFTATCRFLANRRRLHRLHRHRRRMAAAAAAMVAKQEEEEGHQQLLTKQRAPLSCVLVLLFGLKDAIPPLANENGLDAYCKLSLCDDKRRKLSQEQR